MNSLKIAKELIRENDSDLADRRRAKAIVSQRIEEYKHEIAKHEKCLEISKHALKMAENDLETLNDRIEELLVDNMALETFIGYLTANAD